MDLIVVNGRVETMDSRDSVVQAVGIRNGRIAALGTNDEVSAYKHSRTTVIDAQGKTVLPGFIEPHNHMVGYSTDLLDVDVRTPPNRNIGDIVELLRERAYITPPGDWIRGRGYDDTGLQDMRHPTHHDLDAVSAVHPIAIVHNSGHMLAANSLALEMAGIHDETPDPPGGRIGRFRASGEPDGMLYETAQTLIHRLLPTYTEEDVRNGFVQAQEEYLRRGITTIHDAGVGNARGIDILHTYHRAKREGFLKFRVNMFIQWAYLKDSGFAWQSGDGDEWIRVAGCKIISDGSIQGITAALREPYHCDPDEQGWLIYEQDELNDIVMTLHRRGYQIATHANGDAAIDAVLAAYENALLTIPKADHRFRIEHCQVCVPDHISRMRALGVIPDFFPNHVYYFGDRHRDRFLGPERVTHLDPIGSTLRSGIKPLLHSDCPVTPVNPLFCIQNAIDRLTSSGNILSGAERVSTREAISMMTVNAAFSSFEENVKGSLEVGKLGDLVVLQHDPFREVAHELGQIESAATIVGGHVMYRTDDISMD
ncbi:MAG: amidohydrolase [Dehalococcoidia bacterium]|nr:amidohydrolase [Dehalococcoidia bacterium]